MGKLLNYEDVLVMKPSELSKWVINQFVAPLEIPEKLETIEHLKDAAETLAKINNGRNYIDSLLIYISPKVREFKRNASKEEYQDMIDRRNILQEVTNLLNKNYEALSRLVTIKKMIDQEMYMNDYM